MADDVRDVLMKLTLNGSDIEAESSAFVEPTDKLANVKPGEFVAADKSNNWKGNFFAVKEFKMDMGLLGDSADDPAAQKRQQEEQQKLMFESIKKDLDQPNLASSRGSSDFQSFMNPPAGGASKTYSANLEPVTLTKYLDASSLVLFKACIESTTIDSAVMIKRRGGGAKHLGTYLRIEFTDLLITDFNWDEDDVILEKISFVCRKASVFYRLEQHSGKMQSKIQQYEWTAENLKAK